jgi:hypothetical protein
VGVPPGGQEIAIHVVGSIMAWKISVVNIELNSIY